MPWKCPACSTQIRHSDSDSTPRPGVTYRCPVCRLELVVDEQTNRLTVPQITADEPASRKQR
jgi:predicted Zn finger-like uncharacterized protein